MYSHSTLEVVQGLWLKAKGKDSFSFKDSISITVVWLISSQQRTGNLGIFHGL
jgi:hypothetical protein